MIPETISGKASQGEKTLFAILRDKLSSDFIVWHNPRVNGLEADFILLSKDFGLLVIEVKGYFGSNIKRANRDFFEIQRVHNGVPSTESEMAPLSQCRRYLFNLMDEIKEYPVLCNPDGKYAGKPICPIGHAAVMSNITSEQARENNLIKILEPPQVAFRDELLSWKEIEESELVARLKRMFTTNFSFKTLTRDQISTIKGIIYPEFVAKSVLATSESVPEGFKLTPECKILKTLEVEQERLARGIGEGHRLFSGVAGSGKTIILMSRAKFLISRDPESKILVLCYNITLAAELRSLIHNDPLNPQYKKIEIRHFHSWAKKVLGSLPNPKLVSGDYDEHLGKILSEKFLGLNTNQKYDSVLVDEAHTLPPCWLKCCVEALKDPENGSLTIVSDASQSLYERTKFTWLSIGIKARGRSKKLSENYRNTQEILAAAWSIIDSIQAEISDKRKESTFPIIKPSACSRHGDKPIFKRFSSRKNEVDAVIRQVIKLSKQGYQYKDIAILYKSIKDGYEPFSEQLINGFSKNDIPSYLIRSNSRESKIHYSSKLPGVKIITSLSSLGLEFKVVFVLWVQQFSSIKEIDKRQLYVSMTRAQNLLYISGSGKQQILDDLAINPFFATSSPTG